MSTVSHPEVVERAWTQREYQAPLFRNNSLGFQEAYDYGIPRGVTIQNIGRPILVTCIEDGIVANRAQLRNYDLVRTAGAGVLNVTGTIQQLQERLQAPGAPEVAGAASHIWCGAVALQKARTGTSDDPKDIGVRAAHDVNTGLGGNSVQYLGEIDRGEDLHPARAVYYDATHKGVEPSRHPYLPQGFVVSRGWIGQEIGMHDAALAARIAFGEHGFGQKFTADTPFWVVGITDDDHRSVSTDQLDLELSDLVGQIRQTILGGIHDDDLRLGVDMIVVSS